MHFPHKWLHTVWNVAIYEENLQQDIGLTFAAKDLNKLFVSQAHNATSTRQNI